MSLSVFDQHARRIALATLKMSASGARIMGQSHAEAIEQLSRIAGYDNRPANIEAIKYLAACNSTCYSLYFNTS